MKNYIVTLYFASLPLYFCNFYSSSGAIEQMASEWDSRYGKRKQEIGEGKYNEDFKVDSCIRIKLISLRKNTRGDSAKFVPFWLS